uniref:Uncharacterized protein n=1 Tax=Phytophthora ramorum TaxID=164328 RepID=H3GRD6_PHYRM
MWYCFGRSSDLGYIRKQHVSVSADSTFYLRLLRVKTTEEQGLTLVPDKDDFLTCLLHALAAALATQDSPCAALLGQLPELVSEDAMPFDLDASCSPATAVFTLPTSTETQTPTVSTQKKTPKQGEDRVQAYVNRMLKRVAEPAGVAADLTSHSFRRGGAQHANGDDRLGAQWVFDLGAWDMTKTNKAFAYTTNTARENRKVARVLGGWGADDNPSIIDIVKLDHPTQGRLGHFQTLLFSSCSGLKVQRLNVSNKVHSVLTAYLIRYYPRLKKLSPTVPIVMRVDECMMAVGILTANMLAWSIALNNGASQPVQESEQDTSKHTSPRIDHRLDVVDEFIASNKAMAVGMTIVETALLPSKGQPETTEEEQSHEASNQEPKPKRRKKQATNLSSMWFEWYMRLPRVWDSTERQKKSESRHVVAFMKLFLDQIFVLDAKAEVIKDHVLEIGHLAERNVLEYLRGNDINAKGTGSVFREMRKLLRSGGLDERIVANKFLLATERFQDPAPADKQAILSVTGHA